ncbi:MAG TPA: hypothetical protein VNK06_06300, partial [Thermodesulfobacteriota bacterium]|nr:hypothetical protein [Thermodesulfobacteriota bacterium]
MKSRASRVLLLALLGGLSFFLPSQADALERDQYLIRTLVARIQFEYEKGTITDNGKKSQDESRFKQTYSLDTRGNILSRYLIIYDAGASFSRNDYSSTNTNLLSDEYNLNFRTTFLPKSAIPLTLYGGYNNLNLSGLIDPYKHTRLTYGLNWFSSLRALPRTLLTIERVNEKTTTTDTVSTDAKIKLEKEIGPTQNQFEYVYQTSDDQNSRSYGNASVVSASNSTRLSKNTIMSIGATRSESKSVTDTFTDNLQTTSFTLEGLTLGLISRPSQEFNQTHNYTFFKNKNISTGSNTGSTYSGDLNYGFSDRLKSHVGLTYSEHRDETQTSKSKDQNVSTSDSISYSLTDNLSLSEMINYTKTTTNVSEGVTAANVGGRSSLRLLTTLAYRKNLPFGRFGAGYSLGYIEDNITKRKGGKGIEQIIRVGLTNIEVVPHVGFSTTAHYDSTKNLSGDIGGRSYGYDASVYNRSLEKYVNILGTYDKETTDSWIDVLEQRRETYRLSVSSQYFRNTKMRASADHTNDFNAISGFSNTSTQELSVSHLRRLLGGFMNLTASFTHFTLHSSGEPQKTTTKYYELKYSRPFYRTLFWQLLASRNERTDQATFVNVTTLENGVF